MLDGELVADAGRASDFYRLGPRLWSRHRTEAVSFAIFGVLCLDGDLTTMRPYHDRRRLLEELALVGPSWCTVSSFTIDLRDVFDACAAHGLKGVVAKRLDGVYHCGKRTKAWLKVKTPDWKTAHAPLRHERYDEAPRFGVRSSIGASAASRFTASMPASAARLDSYASLVATTCPLVL